MFVTFVTISDIMIKLTCLQNPNKPSSIDLFLTNWGTVDSFQNRITLETGLTDFHIMIVTVMTALQKTKIKKMSNKDAAKCFQKIHLVKNWIMMKSFKITKQFLIFRF